MATLKAEKRCRAFAHLIELIDGPLSGEGAGRDGIATHQKALMQSDTSSLQKLSSFMTILAWVMLGGGVALGIAIALVTARSIVKPLGLLNRIMQRLAARDLNVEVRGAASGRRDRRHGENCSGFKESMIETDRLNTEQRAEQERQLDRSRKMDTAIADFDSMISEVVDSVSAAAAGAAGNGAIPRRQCRADIASIWCRGGRADPEQMTQNVQTVASATEELTASITEISAQVSESTRIIGGAVTQAEDTNAKVAALAGAAQHRRRGDADQ